MVDMSKWRAWITPITVWTFIVVAITGIMMLFELRLPYIKGFHEWIGLAFAIAGLFHLITHWRTFCSYFTRRETMLALAGVVVLMLLLSFIGGDEKGPHGPNGPNSPSTARESFEE